MIELTQMEEPMYFKYRSMYILTSWTKYSLQKYSALEKNWLWKNTHKINLLAWLFLSVQFSNINYISVQTISITSSYLVKLTLYSL